MALLKTIYRKPLFKIYVVLFCNLVLKLLLIARFFASMGKAFNIANAVKYCLVATAAAEGAI